ncbi:MAG: zinc-ribbon domain-containing protein [Alphaproteobacteria bacterium]|nr:zinc-ribbon domain-containing protein [Alphaproteobacteria bacterium]
MIVSCPSCDTRYDIGDQSHAHGPMAISCRSCGHRWKELPVIDVVDVPSRAVARVVDYREEPEFDVQRLVEAAKSAKEEFAQKRRQKMKRLGGWASFALLVLAPFLSAALMPETVVMAAPATVKIYEKLGYTINIYGVDIRRVEQQNTVVDGAHVLLVKGEISNSTNSVRKIPSLRFALSGDDAKELYTWTLDTTSRPLRPGETTTFTTRVAQPPELAKNLKIRFAHLDEISSNASP